MKQILTSFTAACFVQVFSLPAFLYAVEQSTPYLPQPIGLEEKAGDCGSNAPNILIILADDMGWSDLGCYGGEIQTPNLDRLADNGIRFRQFRNTAKCMTTRASLLTGLYPQQTDMMLPKKIRNAVTLGEVLKARGYRTLWVGKHHGTENPVDRGFDRYFGLRDGACNHFNPGLQRDGEAVPARKRDDRVWCIDDKELVPYTPPNKDFYTTDAFTDTALDYLDTYRDERKPFFLYVAYTAPHDPLMAWPEDIKTYDGVYDEGFEVIRNARYKKQLDLGLIDGRYPLTEPTYSQWQNLSLDERKTEALRMQVYAAMVDRMDQNIGRILAKLDSLNELENTLILFASDNGASAEVVHAGDNIPGNGEMGSMSRWTSQEHNWANVSNTPFRFFKNYSHEGGINTPLIAHWPAGISNPGRFDDFAGHFIDIMPTLLEISGAIYPAEFNGEKVLPYEGTSIVPVFKESAVDRATPIFWQWDAGKAVINGRWKLVCWNNDPGLPEKWELYDLEYDRTESRDLAEEHPGVVKQLGSLYQHWLWRVAK
ncbi:arylsulfatase [Puniceicoccales bacterium CK1056]|uniref:Arylsulfatase n=1 Tax=Oceanipulchritudo coccoides TaxID=2706888 RepID=A0A6B2LYP0_9BACT|nr:arylsulfatase [Oceanipulchritudo coccoides]NDV61728.1 arylsulfatase [Oceanipulchritudo coccoides]